MKQMMEIVRESRVKKIEKGRQFVQQHINTFRCPVCHEPMESIDGNSVVCAKNHHIDFNKHGYLYFLKQGAGTEYDGEMLSARRKLLMKGLFKPIVEKISQQMNNTDQTILDVGCGEGTPLSQLMSIRNKHDTAIGFDISKPGIQLATQLDTNAFFCVADLRQLPFNNASFDTLVEIFSPSDYGEFKRVLKPNGKLYKVIPNAGYLGELRNLLYDTGDHQTYDNSKVLNLFKSHFSNVKEFEIKYQFEIPNDLKKELVLMTPMHWGRDAKTLTDQDLEGFNEVTVDVTLLEAENA